MVVIQRMCRHGVSKVLQKCSRSLEEPLHHHRPQTCLSSARWSSTPSDQNDYESSTGCTTPTSQNDNQKRNRVVVAMSGGVDSSVAAYLLQMISRGEPKSSHHPHTSLETRHNDTTNNREVDIIGLHMSNWNALDEDSDEQPSSSSTNDTNRRRRRGQKVSTNDASSPIKPSRRHSPSLPLSTSNGTAFCQTSENEYNDANSVARHLDLPLHRVSFASEYWIQVFEPFIDSLSSSSSDQEEFSDNGHRQMTMPNPDYGCNTYIKFGAMRDYAMNKLDADYVATGHYAQLWHRDYLTTSLGEQATPCESSSFHQWMIETSQSLEQQVLESIAGRPEEDWILNNHNHNMQSKNHGHDVPRPLPMLLAGVDRSKDQTYFLSGVKAHALRNVIFPLGHLEKRQSATTQVNNNDEDNTSHPTVRDIALHAQIPTASKQDSMGICFIGKRNFGQFVSQYLPRAPHPGNFVDVDTGEVVGRHEGAVRYTLGEGAKISGANVRYFVCGKGCGDDGNTVFVCNSTHHPALYADELTVDFDAFNWIGLGDDDGGTAQGRRQGTYNHIPRPLVEGYSIQLRARVRHLQPLTPCTVTWDQGNNNEGRGKGHLTIRFAKAMRAITPGQIVALYAGSNGLICLGGGIISRPGASYMDRGVDVMSTEMLHPSGYNDLSLRNA